MVILVVILIISLYISIETIILNGDSHHSGIVNGCINILNILKYGIVPLSIVPIYHMV